MPRATGTEVARARPAAPARGARARAGASYVFLGAGRTSYPSGRVWPAPRAGGPGDWLVDPEAGVQACAPGDLAWWLD